MAARSTLCQLEEVQDAIQMAIGNKSWAMDGMTYTQQDLSALQKREETLLRRLSMANVRKRTRPDFS